MSMDRIKLYGKLKSKYSENFVKFRYNDNDTVRLIRFKEIYQKSDKWFKTTTNVYISLIKEGCGKKLLAEFIYKYFFYNLNPPNWINCRGSKCRLAEVDGTWCVGCSGDVEDRLDAFVKPGVLFKTIPLEQIIKIEEMNNEFELDNKSDLTTIYNFVQNKVDKYDEKIDEAEDLRSTREKLLKELDEEREEYEKNKKEVNKYKNLLNEMARKEEEEIERKKQILIEKDVINFQISELQEKLKLLDENH